MCDHRSIKAEFGIRNMAVYLNDMSTVDSIELVGSRIDLFAKSKAAHAVD